MPLFACIWTNFMNRRIKEKRVTIHDIAKAVGIAPSSVSKALNNLPSVSEKVKTLVKAKAQELNYKHNLNAANLRRGSSRTIGVIVPKVNVAFFADTIAGIEEACFENNHRLIICQSNESFEKEVQAVETLIQQNVDCVLISLSQETQTIDHLKDILHHHIHLIQFDRVNHSFDSHIIVNDNEQAACKAVRHLIEQGYRRIAFLGGPEYLPIYSERKNGYLTAIKEADLDIPYTYIVNNAAKTESAMAKALELFYSKNPPDAFFTVSDSAALGVLKAARSFGLQVPEDLGIIGFSNEAFTEFTTPTLSSVMQWGKELGREAVNIYFNTVLKKQDRNFATLTIESTVATRESSTRFSKNKRLY